MSLDHGQRVNFKGPRGFNIHWVVFVVRLPAFKIFK